MIPNKSEFITSAVTQEQYPDIGLPEIAFSGRSNVGKSSIMNSLMNRRNLVKVSSKPGKTRLINFFLVNNDVVLVDLPGYGYAAVSQESKRKWGQMIETYLVNREVLKNVVLLVDIRHNPNEDDKMMYHFLKHYRGKVVVVATKSDKISKTAAVGRLEEIKETLELDETDILVTYSSLNHDGRDELWDILMS